jgi:hypothetical protein
MKIKNAKIRETVYDLLVKDKVARSDDIYLYKMVIKELVPNLLNNTFENVLTEHFDNGFIHFETVRRTRAAIQSENPNLVDETTYKKRKKFKESYIKELLCN